MIFVDRDRELKESLAYVRNNTNVLLYGLRGVGKTALLEKLVEILSSEGINVLKINGYEISSIHDVASIIDHRGEIDAKLILSELFMKDDYVIIIDEFTAFMRIFVGKTLFSSLD